MVGGEGRVLRRQVLLPATGALQRLGISTSTKKLFEFGSAIVTGVFKDRHALLL
jgi:hypothetical protein